MSEVVDSTVLSEHYLVGSAMAGDKSAYAILYKRHYEPLVEKIAARFLQGKTEPARDIAQQAFLDVYHTLKEIDRSVPFADSLMDAAEDRFLHHADEHERLKRTNSFDDLDEDHLHDEDTESVDPVDIVDRHQNIAHQLAALETLLTLHKSSGKRYTAGLRYLFAMCEQGLSAEEIAQRENKTPDQINKAIVKACSALRPALAPILN